MASKNEKRGTSSERGPRGVAGVTEPAGAGGAGASSSTKLVVIVGASMAALALLTQTLSAPRSGERRGGAAIEAEAGTRDPLAAPPDVAAVPAAAERTASGLASRVLRPGTGARHPTERSRVTVHYTGWQTDGTRFDSSRERGEPATFPLDGVIAGWTEGLQLMVEGEERRFWIPADLAYGDPPRRPGAPGGMLVFDVELLSIR